LTTGVALLAAPASAQSRGQSMNPDISLVSDLALAYFSADTPRQTGAHDPSRTGFNLQQLELTLGSAVDPYFRFDANLVFSLTGVEIEEAYATTLSLPGGFQVRAGQFLTRFGRINNTHPHAWDFVDQPFAIGRVFGGEGNRNLGVETSYLVPLPWYSEAVLSVTDAHGDGTARSFLGGADLPSPLGLDLQATAALKQFFELSDDLSLLWGLSFAGGPNATGHKNFTEVYGTDLYVKLRPESSFPIIAFQTEWLYRRRQVPGDVLSDLNGYAQLSWLYNKHWGTAFRYEYGSPALTRGMRFTTDPLDPEWSSHRHRASLSATWWPTEFSRLRLQGALDAFPGQRPLGLALFLAAEFVIGAHGAHSY
jgi:hypothetical protein